MFDWFERKFKTLPNGSIVKAAPEPASKRPPRGKARNTSAKNAMEKEDSKMKTKSKIATYEVEYEYLTDSGCRVRTNTAIIRAASAEQAINIAKFKSEKADQSNFSVIRVAVQDCCAEPVLEERQICIGESYRTAKSGKFLDILSQNEVNGERWFTVFYQGDVKPTVASEASVRHLLWPEPVRKTTVHKIYPNGTEYRSGGVQRSSSYGIDNIVQVEVVRDDNNTVISKRFV